MASKRETTIANSIADFGTLIAVCKGYGSKYNPSKAGLAIPALESILQRTKASTDVLDDARNAHTDTVIHRKLLFKQLNKLAGRILSAFDITDAPEAKKEDLHALVLKVQGRKLLGSPDPEPVAQTGNAPRKLSTSQMGFVNRAANFRLLVKLLKNEPAYTPNETELQTATLGALADTLDAANEAEADASVVVGNALNARDAHLYAPNGLMNTGIDTRKYVKSVYSVNTPEYKKLVGLQFRKRKGFPPLSLAA